MRIALLNLVHFSVCILMQSCVHVGMFYIIINRQSSISVLKNASTECIQLQRCILNSEDALNTDLKEFNKVNVLIGFDIWCCIYHLSNKITGHISEWSYVLVLSSFLLQGSLHSWSLAEPVLAVYSNIWNIQIKFKYYFQAGVGVFSVSCSAVLCFDLCLMKREQFQIKIISNMTKTPDYVTDILFSERSLQ